LAFRGHFEYTLDAKNRLNVPPPFRAAFADGVVLSQWFEPCIAVWTPEGLEAFTDTFLPKLNPVGARHRTLSSFFAHGAFDTKLDGAGRVTLNKPLIDLAGLKKDVIVAGSLNHLEVWDPTRWRDYQREVAAEVTELAESLDDDS
jgi:MraZ protein